MKVYPIYLNQLHEKKTVLIGGNHEAERKTRELLECDANLTVISIRLTDELHRLESEKRFTWIPREYRYGDLKGAFLVIAAEFTGDTNKRVFSEANKLGILVNVMDDIPHCNFAFGSLVKRGPLTLSVSTSGAAPALAVRLRERFENEFGPEYGVFLDFMQKLRKPMSRHHTVFDDRKRIWYNLIDSGILEHMRNGNTEHAIGLAADIAGQDVVNDALGITGRQKAETASGNTASGIY
jgi:precorrin-2 dehydrogenase / sirohydrochlorin ferrochelatase